MQHFDTKESRPQKEEGQRDAPWVFSLVADRQSVGRTLAPERLELYNMYMSEIPVSEARERLADVIAGASRSGEPVYLTRHGKAVAVVVDPDIFERLLLDAEDALDRAELTLARDEGDYVPWEQVKAELGLV